VLSGDPALREELIDSAPGNIPVIGTDLRSEVHPLEGNAVALVNLGLFLLAFMVLTVEPLRAREVAIGALVATVFWEALQLIGTWYVARGLRTATPTYGVFAGHRPHQRPPGHHGQLA
jgi:hypothetical protein